MESENGQDRHGKEEACLNAFFDATQRHQIHQFQNSKHQQLHRCKMRLKGASYIVTGRRRMHCDSAAMVFSQELEETMEQEETMELISKSGM